MPEKVQTISRVTYHCKLTDKKGNVIVESDNVKYFDGDVDWKQLQDTPYLRLSNIKVSCYEYKNPLKKDYESERRNSNSSESTKERTADFLCVVR